jgi:secreted Zn-dependent insulinase-like peptidase
MRTKQQLGYVVQMNNNKLNNNFYLYQFIQSDKECDYLEKRINEFNNKLKSKLKKINITKWVNTLKNHLEEKENSTYDLFNKYNNQIVSRQFLFTKNQLLLNQLENITLKSLIEFADTYLFNNTNKTVIKVNKKKLNI